MSEENTEKRNDGNNFKWTFDEKTYPLFLVNRTGNIGMPILDPTAEGQKMIGRIVAYFAWENAEPFTERLTVETIDKASQHSDWTERENDSLIQKNADFFVDTCQGGISIKIDPDTSETFETRKTAEEMRKYRKPVQADLVSLFLKEFHISRYLPEGFDELDALLSNPEEIYFLCKIGDFNNPSALLLFCFKAPSDDAISIYQKDSFNRKQNTQGDWKYTRDSEMQLRFAKKHFSYVEGAMLGPKGEIEFDDSQLKVLAKTDTDGQKAFLRDFNPDWLIKLAEELSAVFNLGKK